MKWEECNFLEKQVYQHGFLSKGNTTYYFCRMKDHYDWDSECGKENCIFIKICNKLGV